jgi:hypothetical protein
LVGLDARQRVPTNGRKPHAVQRIAAFGTTGLEFQRAAVIETVALEHTRKRLGDFLNDGAETGESTVDSRRYTAVIARGYSRGRTIVGRADAADFRPDHDAVAESVDATVSAIVGRR